ncbi:MAG: CDP-glycerol glycerophosphotransferase family protein [Ancrocorticia sp.]|uniref:CDP-glycerol glycerophosphotransferase family protein n=1 Tax=Ancrocorticia sp. TaxID=2593684 RepID=UPI003F926C62
MNNSKEVSGAMPQAVKGTLLDLDAVITSIEWHENIHLRLTLDISGRITQPLPVASESHGELSGEAVEADHYCEFFPDATNGLAKAVARQKGADAKAVGEAPEPAALELTWDNVPDGDDLKGLQFMFLGGHSGYFLEAAQLGRGVYAVEMNITNFFERKAIPNGTWAIVPVLNGKLGVPARMPLSEADKLLLYSRNYVYNQNFSAYTVTFRFTEDDVRPELRTLAYAFGRGRGKSKASLPRKVANKLLGKDSRKRVLNSVYWTARRSRKPEKPVVLLASEARTSLGGNLEAIRDRLLERGLDKDFTITENCMLPSDRSLQQRIRQVEMIANADILIVDDYFASLETLKMDPKTEIIQAWHAGVGFKSVGYSRFGNYGSPVLRNPHRFYDHAIVGSKNLIPVYADVFGIEESAIVPTGLPRIDHFLSEEGKEKALKEFKAAYPQAEGKKLIVFAPTFRGRGMNDAYYDYSRLDFDALYELCGENTVFGFRMHHFITEPVPIRSDQKDRFIDLTHYHDGLGLLHSADVLISDYSSIIYEYSLLNRPMLFFAYDRDLYAATRGFHRDYDETAPGKVCLSFDELLESLKNEDYELEKAEAFRQENFDRIDTHSSDRFIDWLILGKQPQE